MEVPLIISRKKYYLCLEKHCLKVPEISFIPSRVLVFFFTRYLLYFGTKSITVGTINAVRYLGKLTEFNGNGKSPEQFDRGRMDTRHT